jgi:hypothetical protein
LQQKEGEWVLGSNPNIQLISRNKFIDLLNGENNGLGNMSSESTENRWAILGRETILFFKTKPAI